MRSVADSMVANKLVDLGYNYIILDDCWAATHRDDTDSIIPDPSRFPSGMKALADYLHSKNIKLGLYTDVGNHVRVFFFLLLVVLFLIIISLWFSFVCYVSDMQKWKNGKLGPLWTRCKNLRLLDNWLCKDGLVWTSSGCKNFVHADVQSFECDRKTHIVCNLRMGSW